MLIALSKFRGLRAAALGLEIVGATLLALPTTSAAASAVPASALTNWQAALKCFQKAGAAIGDNQLERARDGLGVAATNLAPPYDAMAVQFTLRIAEAVKTPSDPKNPKRVNTLVKLCAELHAYDAALRLQSAGRSAEDLADDPTYAWRLFEAGKSADALATYKHKLADETVDAFADYYRDQIRLAEQRPANLTNAQFSLDFVRLHYLNGLEEKADSLSAVQELYRVLPYAHAPTQAVAAVEAIIARLSSLGDEPGRDAWEDKLLKDFKTQREACANVRLERGLRAFKSRDYPKALTLLRPVCAEYADTVAYGDAQYTVGLALQQQSKFDEAMAEYYKIFPSNVRDHDLDPEKSDDCKNYRHRTALRISECYAAKANFALAVSWVEQARDRYTYNSYCNNCIKENKAYIEARLNELKALAAKQAPAPTGK